MSQVRRPTLVRRVVLALLAASCLVWVALMAYQLYSATDRARADVNLRALGESMLASVAQLDKAGEARAVIAATSELINANYRASQAPGVVLMALDDSQGRLLYSSPEGGGAILRGEVERIVDAQLRGQPMRVYRGATPRWSLSIAAPSFSTWWLARRMSGELSIDILIAFPLVLLPLWLVVARGLRPLRQLSERIAARGSEDLSPLDIDPRYAELAPLAGALDTLMRRLRHKIAREHGFVQDAAHELRTPMAVISAQAHVLARSADGAEREQAERRLEHAIGRASRLIAQLLALAQIDAERAAGVATIDLAQLVRQELAQAMPAAQARGLELSLDAPDTLVLGIELLAFQSILHNLLSNALAYVQDGGQIAVGLARDGALLRLNVADNGPGIPEPERELVFERFYRAAGGRAPGAGLGLAIVRVAAGRLGGTVALKEGAQGRGCVFEVRIPVRA